MVESPGCSRGRAWHSLSHHYDMKEIVASSERLIAFWQAQQPFGNNATLDLRGALFNRIAARAQQAVLPSPIVQRLTGALGQHGARTLQHEGELVHPLVEFAPEHFRNRTLGTRGSAALEAREIAVCQILHRLDVYIKLR